jgi:hypothetical protein
MDGDPIAGWEDLAHHREPGLQAQPPAHDDVVQVQVRVSERRPHIVDPSPSK